jgi:hypothetical protein
MGSQYPDDAVQDMILKALKYGQGVNEPAYYYFVLRGCVAEQHKTDDVFLPLYDWWIHSQYSDEGNFLDEIKPEVNQALNDQHFYYKWLYDLYTDVDQDCNSIRKISEATGISTHTIFRDLTKIKEFIKKNVEQ